MGERRAVVLVKIMNDAPCWNVRTTARLIFHLREREGVLTRHQRLNPEQPIRCHPSRRRKTALAQISLLGGPGSVERSDAGLVNTQSLVGIQCALVVQDA